MLTIFIFEELSSITSVGSRGNEMTLVVGRGYRPPEAEESLGIERKYPMKFIVP